jgi:hypothetical protein
MSAEHLEQHHSHCLLLAELPGSWGGAVWWRRAAPAAWSGARAGSVWCRRAALARGDG